MVILLYFATFEIMLKNVSILRVVPQQIQLPHMYVCKCGFAGKQYELVG